MWTVYIIQSEKDGSYYVGCSNNHRRRLMEHNLGQNVSTKLKAPWITIYTESFVNQNDAFAREKKIKSYKGGNAFKKLITK